MYVFFMVGMAVWFLFLLIIQIKYNRRLRELILALDKDIKYYQSLKSKVGDVT